MNLDDLVQAAIAKALADYIGTLTSMDEGFMGKLADLTAERVWKRMQDYHNQADQEAHRCIVDV